MLRDLGPADVDPYVQAFVDDPPLLADLGAEEAPRPKDVRARLRRQPRLRERDERLMLALAEPQDDVFVGEIVLHHLMWEFRRAEVGFFVIARARRRGIALEALNLITEWAFAELGVHRMQLVTLSDNEPTQRLAHRAGFEREGTLRDYTFEHGAFKDNVMFARLAA